MTAGCLTSAELETLTDCKRRKEQVQWLVDHGWRFEMSATGRVKVARAEFAAKMLSDPPQRGRGEPDFAAI